MSGVPRDRPAERFSVNISTVFADLPLLERPAAAAEAGFHAIESWWPYPGDSLPDPTALDAFASAVDQAGVHLVCLNFDGGDRSAGDRGMMCRPEQAARVRDHIPVAAALAKRLSCRRMNALFGNITGREISDEEWAAARVNYRLASAAVGAGTTILIEPLNASDAPHYPIRTVADALAVLSRLGISRLGVMMDTYHLSQSESSLSEAFTAAGPAIGHVQLGDFPGRRAPGKGTVDFSGILTSLRTTGYEGFIGLEYHPEANPIRSARAIRQALSNRMGDRG